MTSFAIADAISEGITALCDRMAVVAKLPFTRVFLGSQSLQRNTRLFRLFQPEALLAVTSGAAVLSLIGVITAFGVWMAKFAVRLATIGVCVIKMRKKAQVVGINAFSIPASVVNFKTLWDVFHEYLVRNAMSLNGFEPNSKLGIAFSGQACSPVPAAGCGVQFKLLNESVNEWSVCGHRQKDAPHPGSDVRVDWRQPEREALNSVSSTFRGHIKAVLRQYLSPQRTSRKYA